MGCAYSYERVALDSGMVGLWVGGEWRKFYLDFGQEWDVSPATDIESVISARYLNDYSGSHSSPNLHLTSTTEESLGTLEVTLTRIAAQFNHTHSLSHLPYRSRGLMTGPAGSSSIPKDAEQEPVPELKDELNRFREEWKNEVKIKQAPPKDAKHDLDTVVEHVEAEVTQATSPKAGRRKESFVSPSSPSRKRGFSVSSNASLTGATDVKITSPSKTISRPVLSEQAVLNLTESQKKALSEHFFQT